MVRTGASRTLSQLLAVTVTIVVVTLLYLAKTVILPLALAILLTFVLAPVVTCLERIRLPRIVAIPIVLLAAGAALGAVGWTVFVQLVEVTNDLPAYTTNIQNKIQSLNQSKTTSFARAQEELKTLSEQISDLGENLTGNRSSAQIGSSPNRPVAVREVSASPGRLDAISGLLGVVVSIAWSRCLLFSCF
jgi:predicted PurR-regulated permease PerM